MSESDAVCFDAGLFHGGATHNYQVLNEKTIFCVQCGKMITQGAKK